MQWINEKCSRELIKSEYCITGNPNVKYRSQVPSGIVQCRMSCEGTQNATRVNACSTPFVFFVVHLECHRFRRERRERRRSLRKRAKGLVLIALSTRSSCCNTVMQRDEQNKNMNNRYHDMFHWALQNTYIC